MHPTQTHIGIFASMQPTCIMTCAPSLLPSTMVTEGALLFTSPYHNNPEPLVILLALCAMYGKPTPTEKQATYTLFSTLWNRIEPIEAFFNHLNDCYVTDIITTLPYTMEQMSDKKAIMAIQLRPSSNGPPGIISNCTSRQDIVRLTVGTGTTGTNEDAFNNIEHSLDFRFKNLKLVNNPTSQTHISIDALHC